MRIKESIWSKNKEWSGKGNYLLVKCYDNKKVKSPYNGVISPLTQPQVANQQEKKTFRESSRGGGKLAISRPVFQKLKETSKID